MRARDPVEVIGLVLVLTFVFAIAFGWGSNLYQLFANHASMKVAEIVLRLIGILVFPIGAIAGFC